MGIFKMKKTNLLVMFVSLFLGACSSSNTDVAPNDSSTSSVEDAAIESSFDSEPPMIELEVFQPRYNFEDNSFKIIGKAEPNKTIEFLFSNDQIESVVVSDDGDIDFEGIIPDEELKLSVNDGTNEKKVIIKSRSALEELNKTFESIANEAKVDESKSTTVSTDDSDVQNNSKLSEEAKVSSEIEVTKPNGDQIDTLIVFTQMDSEDYGYKLKYKGKDAWNIAVNFIDEKNNWIVTTEDSKYGRVKAIYQWDGEIESGATLVYLLINGDELLNNL